MDVNYEIAGIVLLVMVCLILFLVLRNRKDKRDFEKEANESEIKPDKHDSDKP